MAALALKSSRTEQHSVVRFLWAKGHNAHAVHSDMRPVYGDKCFTRPAIHAWCRELLVAEKALMTRNDLAGTLWRQPMPRLQQSTNSLGPTNRCQFWILFVTRVFHEIQCTENLLVFV